MSVVTCSPSYDLLDVQVILTMPIGGPRVPGTSECKLDTRTT